MQKSRIKLHSNVPVILANGIFPKHDMCLDILRNAKILICTDGSANQLNSLPIKPTYIIGDLDSIDKCKTFNSKIIHDKSQDNTDLEKAIEWIYSEGYRDVIILGATGLREDMSLINQFLIFKYFKKINITTVTDHFTISCIKGEKEIDSFENQLVSLIPENRAIVSSKGLKFELEKANISIDGKTISNKSKKNKFKITSSEKLLVFQSHK
ncbi:MAG: thiamine diphosphokinase [bacterium TMED144]|nr:MAG: thiamine diphosphokinase [bacterium TMED144]|tara:strand:- start:7492 stop:8124 length:633 start_codon:yes stop_codon:yes gene_type:complete